MKRIALLLVLLCLSLAVPAQIISASIKAGGLTCSMCSNSIDKALRTLDFVQDVKPDLATTSFEVTFKPGTIVNIDAVKNKIVGAGFSVTDMKALFHFQGQAVGEDGRLHLENSDYHFVNARDKTLNGDVTLRFVDKGYMTPKKFKQFNRQSSLPCLDSRSDNAYHVMQE